ncbi:MULTISPECIES: hypothetical protein [Microbacterium]|uniref:hypothetical protein n=1 Tax=Microbacterium TaxID=33882 RepID=UPI00344C26B4
MVEMPLTHATSVTSTARPITKLISIGIAALLLVAGILTVSHMDDVAVAPVTVASSAALPSLEATASSTTTSDDIVAAAVGVCVFGVVCSLIAFAWLRRAFVLLGRRRLIAVTRRVRGALRPRRTRVPRPTTVLLCIARV